jgi:DNA-binding beta-propeller fold protein YncE
MLVDVQSRDEVVVIDPGRNTIVRRIHVDCAHPHGLLVDSARRLAFVACDGDAKLLTLDLRSMTITGSATVGPSPDVLALDAGLKRLYVAAESGQVAVFAEHAHSVQKLGQAALAPAAHTVAVDPRTHLVYFPLERGTRGTPQLLVMKPR